MNNDAIKSDLHQRASFQFSIIRLNLIVTGTIVAFALKPQSEYKHALLMSPIISFALFALWVHHTLVIYFNETKNISVLCQRFGKVLGVIPLRHQ